MTILVIGGCGFIGRHVVKNLAASDINLIVYDKNSNIKNNSDRIEYLQGELDNNKRLESIIIKYKVSHIVHLVSTTIPKTSNENMKFDLISNVAGTIALLDLCVKHHVTKIIFMSSGGTVYGIPQSLPVAETHPTDPICSYGICKLTIEKYLTLYHYLHGIQYVIIRAANPYGIGQDSLKGQGIIANYVHKLHYGLPLEVWGDGNIVRDYFLTLETLPF